MHTPTFLQKENFNQFSWRLFFPLFVLLAGLGTSYSALGQAAFNSPSSITISASPTGATTITTEYTAAGPNTPKFTGADLGNGSQFDQATGSLFLTNVNVPVFYRPNTTVTGAALNYRIYSSTASSTPTYVKVDLTKLSDDGSTVTYTYPNGPVDILKQQAVLGGGIYYVEVIFTANYDQGAGPEVTSSPGGTTATGYKANFTVIAPAVTPNGGVTTWISQSSTEWRDAANWSNGVPTRDSDAVIPEKTAVGTTITPVLVDATTPYEVRSITLNGTTNATRALLRIGQSTTNPGVGGTLRVYGDLNTYSGGILASVSNNNTVGVANPATNSTIVLAGDNGGVQVVRGLLEIVDLRIEGNGVKAVVNSIAASNTFTFDATSTAIVQTSNDDGKKDPSTGLSTTVPSLNTTKTATVNLKDSGFLYGEKPNSYIRGVTLADRTLTANVKQTFGNIGLDITPNRDIPSPNVNITRTVGDPLFGPMGNTSTAPAGSPQPIKRQYGVSGDVNNNTTSTITFHYLNSADELNQNPEANLTIFKTANNAPPYALIGRTGNVVPGTATSDGTVTRENYSASLNTITLGDEFNPLPVVLTAFNAVRSNSNSLLTWTTSSEVNNKGFNVQVSSDGTAFHSMGFVASQSPNSLQALNYRYTDTESGKVGTRYYRLLQTDLNGKESYSPVRAVSFDGAIASAATLVAYPNPFVDKLDLNLEGSSLSDGLAYIKLVDMAGRTVREQNISLVGSSLSFDNMSDLRSGLYLAKVTLPDGSTKTVRVQKQ